jgi:hypothetical protein
VSSEAEQPEPTDAELRAAWEEQLRVLTAADLIVQTVVSLINLAGRRLGLDPGAEGERDLEQARDAIDGVRALMPVLERREPADALAPLRDALSALQLHYARLAGPASGGPAPSGGPGPAPEPAPREESPPGAGPAQRSGRLWVPGS